MEFLSGSGFGLGKETARPELERKTSLRYPIL